MASDFLELAKAVSSASGAVRQDQTQAPKAVRAPRGSRLEKLLRFVRETAMIQSELRSRPPE